jgi:TRAP-type C4-dicarboxylate transport system permease small subunit
LPAITGSRSVLNRLIDKAIAACGAVAMVSIVGMGALITIDVIMRSVGYGVVRGGVEAVEYLMFLTALFAAPWVLRHNAHIRVDFLLENAPRPIALVFEVAINLIGLVVVGIFIFYAARIGLQSAEEARKIYKNFIFPEWWIYAAASLALAMLWIEFLRRILRPFGGRQSQALKP